MEGDSDGVALAERQKLHDDIELMKNVLQDDEVHEYSEGEEEGEEEEEVLAEDECPGPTPQVAQPLSSVLGFVDRDQGNGEGGSTYSEPKTDDSVFRPVVVDEAEEDDDSEYEDKDEGELLIHLDEEDLPTDPQTCLALNRAYQEVIVQNLDRLELALVNNREQQQLLKAEIDEDLKVPKLGPGPGRIRPETPFSIPYFKDSDNMCPTSNEDTIVKKRNERDPHLKPPRFWTDDDSTLLRKAMKEDCLQRLIRPLMNRKELEHEKLQKAASEEEKEPIKEHIKQLTKEIEKARWTPEDELFGPPDLDAKIDWMKISAFDFNGQFSASFLNHIWCAQEHPGFSRSRWTQEEDRHLVELAEAHGNKRWDLIAAELGTSRSAFQCLSRFQTKLNPCLETGKWTDAEDNLLKEAVTGLADNNYIPWHLVGDFMEGRTQEKCKERWAFLKQNYRKGRWTPDEDKQLLAAVHCYGQNWVRVHEFVPSRTLGQCRERWQNSLCQEIKYGNWTYEEDRTLILMQQTYGNHWATIAKEMPGRTDNMLLQRHRLLMKWKKQRDILASFPQESVQVLHKMKKKEQKSNDIKSKKTTQKIERLLEQRMAEKEWREKQQKEDMMLSGSENDGKGPDQGSGQGQVNEQSDITETGSGGEASGTDKSKGENKKMSVLDLVAKKIFRERQATWEHERKLIEKDLKNGIYVPRPPCVNVSTRRSLFVQARCSLSNIILKHVRETLESTSKSTPENVFRRMEENIKLQNQEHTEPTVTEEVLPKHIKDILSMAGSAHKRSTRIGRPVTEEEVVEVEDELAMLLRDRTTRKGKHGRPRRFFVDEDSAANKDRDGHLGDKVTKIMMLALNMDKEGAVGMAKAIKRNEQDSSNEGSVMLVDNFEKTTMTKPHVSPKVLEDIDLLTKVLGSVDTIGPDPMPKVQRKAHKKSAAKVYKVPILPPNCLTLNAFRQLLLLKQHLVTQGGRHCLKESAAGKDDEEEEIQMPNNEPRTKPRAKALKSTDIDEALIKKLSHKYPKCQVLEARDALRKMERQQRKKQRIKEAAKKGAAQKAKTTVMTIVKRTHDYNMLKARFISLFLWPSLLSTIDPEKSISESRAQEKSVVSAAGSEANPLANGEGDVPPPQPSTSSEIKKRPQRRHGRKRCKGRNRFAMSGGSRLRKLSVKSCEEKELFRKKCEQSYRKRTSESRPGTDSEGQDEVSPSQPKRQRTSSETSSRRISPRALRLEEKKRQKEEEDRKKEQETLVDSKIKKLQRAAAKGSNLSIDKQLLLAGREKRLQREESVTTVDISDPGLPGD